MLNIGATLYLDLATSCWMNRQLSVVGTQLNISGPSSVRARIRQPSTSVSFGLSILYNNTLSTSRISNIDLNSSKCSDRSKLVKITTAVSWSNGGSGTTSSSTATSSAVLNFSTGVPSYVIVGMNVADATNTGAITGNQTVIAVTAITSVTLSANVNATVNSGDTIVFSVTPSTTVSTLVMEHVNISGDVYGANPPVNGWYAGVISTRPMFQQFEDVNFTGAVGPGATFSAGLAARAFTALILVLPTRRLLIAVSTRNHSNVAWANTGVFGNNNIEAIYFQNGVIQLVNIGVNLEGVSSNLRPIGEHDCQQQYRCSAVGIAAYHQSSLVITNNYIFQQVLASAATTGISLQATPNALISGNVFYKAVVSPASTNPFLLITAASDGSFGTPGTVISQNSTQGMSQYDTGLTIYGGPLALDYFDNDGIVGPRSGFTQYAGILTGVNRNMGSAKPDQFQNFFVLPERPPDTAGR